MAVTRRPFRPPHPPHPLRVDRLRTLHTLYVSTGAAALARIAGAAVPAVATAFTARLVDPPAAGLVAWARLAAAAPTLSSLTVVDAPGGSSSGRPG